MTSVLDRPCHLRCSESPDEEFQGPSGEWFSIFRSIVLDSWLTWKDALSGHRLRGPLDEDIACTITVLAQRVHAAHMSLPDYRRLSQSPFTVSRWWDPAATDGWETGSKVLLRLEHYSAYRLAAKIPSRLHLYARSQSEHWLELSLPPDTPCAVHSLDYDRIVTTDTV